MKKLLWKIKYYFQRLKGVDWKGFKNAVDYAHQKSGKNRLFLIIDMIYCSLKYTAGYVDYNEFEFYLLNGKERATYLTLGQSHKVTQLFNDKEALQNFIYKDRFNVKFKGFVNRDYINLKETTAIDLQNFVEKHGQVMAKRPKDYVGRGITKLYQKDITDYQELYDRLIANGQTLVEEFFKQHEAMASLSEKSVNTMRVITFLDDSNTPRVLVVALKSGLGADVDNIGQGGMYTILNDDGVVERPFIDKFGNHHSVHPTSGKDLIGFTVPNYRNLMEQVKQACLLEPKVRYVGWDIAVTPEANIEIIEGNYTSGPFQIIPSLSKDKTGVLPEYKKYIKMQF